MGGPTGVRSPSGCHVWGCRGTSHRVEPVGSGLCQTRWSREPQRPPPSLAEGRPRPLRRPRRDPTSSRWPRPAPARPRSPSPRPATCSRDRPARRSSSWRRPAHLKVQWAAGRGPASACTSTRRGRPPTGGSRRTCTASSPRYQQVATQRRRAARPGRRRLRDPRRDPPRGRGAGVGRCGAHRVRPARPAPGPVGHAVPQRHPRPSRSSATRLDEAVAGLRVRLRRRPAPTAGRAARLLPPHRRRDGVDARPTAALHAATFEDAARRRPLPASGCAPRCSASTASGCRTCCAQADERLDRRSAATSPRPAAWSSPSTRTTPEASPRLLRDRFGTAAVDRHLRRPGRVGPDRASSPSAGSRGWWPCAWCPRASTSRGCGSACTPPRRRPSCSSARRSAASCAGRRACRTSRRTCTSPTTPGCGPGPSRSPSTAGTASASGAETRPSGTPTALDDQLDEQLSLFAGALGGGDRPRGPRRARPRRRRRRPPR